MSTELETYAAALRAERNLALKRAERRARLLDEVGRSRSAPTEGWSEAGIVPMRRLTRAVRSCRAVLRPAQV